jgi:histidyl-tRNA synthetase
VLPDDAPARLELFALTRDRLSAAGYGYFESPVFEDTELFARGVGESTDIVQKEMFSFEDMGGRSLTLRPEGTAPVCRAYVEHGMHKRPQPVRLWYWGPYFRHETPQAGRFRQFTQIGAEVLGSDDPAVDAEVIALLADLLEAAGTQGLRLRISSLGTAATRRDYGDELKAFLRAHAADLAPDVQARIEANPLRAFDSADPGTQATMREAPTLLDRLAPADAEHFAEVRALLDAAAIGHEVDPTLVRGLDYYTRTVFEFTSDALGAQSGVAGGGRYDGLVEQLGGPPTPGIGWAAGVERIALAAGEPPEGDAAPLVFVVVPGEQLRRAGFLLLRRLAREAVAAQMGEPGRSMKGQLKHADRARARFAAIVADGGLELKDMRTGEQRPVGEDELVELARRERGGS